MSNRPWSKKEFKLLRESGGWDSDACETPQWLFEKLNEHFNFFWDACATKHNQKVLQGRRRDVKLADDYDYLKANLKAVVDQSWKPGDVIFMNPPYSNVEPFIVKAWRDAQDFKVVALLRDDPTTDWYNWIVENHKDTYFIDIHQRNSETIVNAIERLSKRTNEKPYNSVGVIHLRRRVRFEYQSRALPFSSNFPHCLMILDRRIND